MMEDIAGCAEDVMGAIFIKDFGNASLPGNSMGDMKGLQVLKVLG